jgi:glycosyltransferase involved in cell wall biosynthesis
VAASHFFHDVIPAALHKLRHGSVPVVYVYHLIGDEKRTPSVRTLLSVAGERFSVALMRLSRALVFIDNHETRQSLTRLGIADERLVMTGNAYDPLISLPEASTSETPSVVFMGRFTAEKGIWDMLALARALKDAVPEARVTMLGDGPLRGELVKRVAREGLQNIDTPGFIDEETKWRRLRAATLFVAPSREEGWGIAVGEALTAGLPVVAYDLPAYSHFGNLPMRVPVDDGHRLISTVVDLLRDPDRLAAERERVHSLTGTLPRWSELLDAELDALARV